MGARYYWPEIGRFIQQDPSGKGVNWYAYAGSNPVVWVDPTGLLSWSDVENAVNTVGSALDAAGNAVVDAVSSAVMDVFWPERPDPCASPEGVDPELADIYAQLGRGEGFDAREASENLLVKPWVAVGLAAGGSLLPKDIPGFSPKWKKRGKTWVSPRGERWHPHAAGPKNPHGAHFDVRIPKGKYKGKWRYYPGEKRWEGK